MADSAFMDEEEHKSQPTQSPATGDFQFQQSLEVHQGAVRSLACLPSGYLMSGSIDTSNKLFMLNNQGHYDFEKELKYHEAFVYSIAPMINGEGFFSAGKDNKVFAVDLIGNPVMMYEGHEGPVNSVC